MLTAIRMDSFLVAHWGVPPQTPRVIPINRPQGGYQTCVGQRALDPRGVFVFCVAMMTGPYSVSSIVKSFGPSAVTLNRKPDWSLFSYRVGSTDGVS